MFKDMTDIDQTIDELFAIKKMRRDNKLMRDFISKIVTIGGPYDHLNGTNIVTDTYTLIENVDGKPLIRTTEGMTTTEVITPSKPKG